MAICPSYPRYAEAQFNLVYSVCKAYPSPRTLAVQILLDCMNDEDPLVRLSAAQSYLDLPLPVDHDDHELFAQDRFVSEALKKVPWLPIEDEREKRALDSFRASEADCKRINDTLWNTEKPDWFERAKRRISRVLGPLTADVLDIVLELSRHGPGSAVGIKGVGSVPSEKYRSPLTMTSSLLPMWKSIVGPLWSEIATPTVVHGSSWSSVPKNAKTNRGIATEPVLNMFLQLGIGDYVSRRLRRFGVDLTDQTWNQTLAEMAWEWNLATLDLSSASDLVSREVVRQLLPPEWVSLLALCRTPKIREGSKGKWHTLEKWSTMGNGYTFSLESLIFSAVIYAVVPPRDRCVTATYGDDMVVPVSAALPVIDALEFLGFRVNKQKSFLAGNFFESCGADFIRGRNCRPFYLKEPNPENPAPVSVTLANGLRLWSLRTKGYSDSRIRPLWEQIRDSIRGPWRGTFVPVHFGDVGLIDSPRNRWKKTDSEGISDQWEGFAARAVVTVPTDTTVAEFGDFPVLLAAYRTNSTSALSRPWLGSRGVEAFKGLFGRAVARLVFSPRWTPGLDWF